VSEKAASMPEDPVHHQSSGLNMILLFSSVLMSEANLSAPEAPLSRAKKISPPSGGPSG